MILITLCFLATALSYYLGVRSPGPGRHGTVKGWIFALLLGGFLAGVFYAFSAFGLIVSIDSLFADF